MDLYLINSYSNCEYDEVEVDPQVNSQVSSLNMNHDAELLQKK